MQMPKTISRTAADPRQVIPMLLTFLLTTLAALLLWQPSVKAQARHVLTGDRIAVFNIAGEMTIVSGEGEDVVVEVTRSGPDGDALSIATGELGGRQTLRVLYPADRVVYGGMGWGSSTNMRVREDGTWGEGRSGGRRVSVRGRGSGLEAHADITIRVPAGKRLAAFVGVGEVTVTDVEGDLMVDTHSGGVKADGVTGSLLVDTGSGSVKVDRVRGDLNVDTGSGTVTMSRISGSRILVDTGSGRVTGSDVQGAHIEVDTGSGGIDLEGVQGQEVLLDTGSGGVGLALLSDIDYVNIDTGSGGVTLTVPATLGARLEVDTGSGGISVDVPCEFAKKSRSYVLATIGDGNGRILIDTGSGRVRIRRP
jgi:hypothetical protein